MSANIDLPAIQRGDTVPFVLNLDDGTNPIDMRGKTIILSVKISKMVEDAKATILKSVTPDASDADAEAGRVEIILESSETGTLIPTVTYFYAIRIQEPGTTEAYERTYLDGKLPVEDS
jgi:hypothetical protein